MGPPLRTFFDGEKPALMQQLNTEFDKVRTFRPVGHKFDWKVQLNARPLLFIILLFVNLLFSTASAWLSKIVYRSDTTRTHTRGGAQETNRRRRGRTSRN